MQPAPAAGSSGEERLTVDPLTGLRNEYLFRLRLPAEFIAARERETNAALLAVKLDNILEINARHGRSGGDEALRAVAYVLENHRSAPERSSHLVFKIGGPVFGYYVPSCSSAEARATAEAIHQRVLRSTLSLERITVSVGIVNFYEFFLSEDTPQQVAARIEQVALQRLGIAERHGANTICDTSEVAAGSGAPAPVVLIVEPEPDSLELLIQALHAAELAVEVREDGEGAMDFIQRDPPRLIICEAMTPRLDGFTIRERLRTNALWSAIPFILISHRKSDEQIRKAVELDIRHYFRKPLSIAEVAGLATNLLRSRAP